MNTKRVIITGANGFLGSITGEWLRRSGYEPFGIDNYSTSSKTKQLPFPCSECDLSDYRKAKAAFREVGDVYAVFHFAALALVSESCQSPFTYFQNNLSSSLNVAELCAQNDIPFLIHSSSCATYGLPQKTLLDESHSLNPLSPYGETKLLAERIYSQYQIWKHLRVLNLRYFNPAGALADAELGEAHEPETHLIPRVIDAAVSATPFSLFGDDYPTPDGTCVRDLIHVLDLAEAHRLALVYLEQSSGEINTVNIGTGRGVSVREVIAATEKVTGKKIETITAPRRPGDPPCLVADTSLMKKLFSWTPQRSLQEMISDHLAFKNRAAVESSPSKPHP